MTLFGRVVAVLDQEHVPCAVIGASALAIHGVPRSTYDIDILVTSPRVLDHALWASLTARDVAVDVRLGDSSDPLRGVVRLTHPNERDVDIVVGRQKWLGDAIAAASNARVQDQDVPVVSAVDLIRLKLYAGGPQDLWDIQQLLAVAPSETQEQVQAHLGELPPDSQSKWDELIRRL